MRKEETKFNGDENSKERKLAKCLKSRQLFNGKTFLREFPDKQKKNENLRREFCLFAPLHLVPLPFVLFS